MKILFWLVILLPLGGCFLLDGANGCPLDGASYVGLVSVDRNDYPQASAFGRSNLSYDGLAVYFPNRDAGDLQQFFVSCGSGLKMGQCCYEVPPDGGDDSSSIALSDWYVTVTDQTAPDSGSYFQQLLTDGGAVFPEGNAGIVGSLTYVPWIGGDKLSVQGDGVGTVGTFSGEIKSPPDFDGLNPGLFADGGVVPVGQALDLTWTPGGAPSVLVTVYDEETFGQLLCAVPDNGSFEVPGSALSNFQPGDRGALAVARSTQSCVYSHDASISFLVQTQTIAGVAFQ